MTQGREVPNEGHEQVRQSLGRRWIRRASVRSFTNIGGDRSRPGAGEELRGPGCLSSDQYGPDRHHRRSWHFAE